jgi:phage baseplate assembly protein V
MTGDNSRRDPGDLRASLRVGIVTVQDSAQCRVRVAFPDHDQMQSWWLPVIVPKTQNDKAYWIPDIGEQVVCLMDAHDEDGAVVGAIYSSADTPPVSDPNAFNLSFKDGASFEYNRSSHALQVSIPTGGTVTIAANGAQIGIDSLGNIQILTIGLIQLGAAGLKGVARLGDTVTCPAGTGTIVSASVNVLAE